MVAHTKFQFEVLHSPNLSYKPGDVIQGILNVQVGRSAQTHGVWCNLGGKCIISCSDSSTLSKKLVDSCFSPGSTKLTDSNISQEVYVNQSLQLLPGHHGNSLGTILHLPFQFLIPFDIPSSFNSPLGYVAYKLVAFVPLTTGFKHVSMLPLTVKAPLSLGTPLRNVLSITARSSPGFLSPLKPDAAITLHLIKQAYAPGEPLAFRTNVKYDEKQKVTSLVCNLVQHVTYHPNAKKLNFTKNNVATANLTVPCNLSDRQAWDLPLITSLVVPPQVVPTDLGGHCSLIKVQYFLKVKLSFTGLRFSLKSQIPVVISAEAFTEVVPFSSPFVSPPPPPYSPFFVSPASPRTPVIPEAVPSNEFSPSAPPAELLYSRC